MYDGPKPSDINPEFKDHTYELVTCLVTGIQKKKLERGYLESIGHTRESYQNLFDGAPLMSQKSRDAYKKAANSKQGKVIRSQNMTRLNLEDNNFQNKRQAGVQKFWNSDKSHEIRNKLSKNAKKQHQNGQSKYVKNYFETRYKGSDDQKNRSKRMTENNPSQNPEILEKMIASRIENSKKGLTWRETRFKKKRYRDTSLIYQSTYEYDFLEKCNDLGILNKIENGPCLTSEMYPYNYYEPDYLFDKSVCIEIKSWYIEELQERKYPDIKHLKEQLVINSGYEFVYILDKDYDEFIDLAKS